MQRYYSSESVNTHSNKLMNTMVVQVMDGNLHGNLKWNLKSNIVASIVALQGYSYFHRMIIALVHEFPQLQQEIDFRVNEFIVSDYNRHKQVFSYPPFHFIRKFLLLENSFHS